MAEETNGHISGFESTASAIIDARWIVAVRLCITVTALLSVTVCTFFGTEETAARVSFLFTPVAILFVLNAGSALWLLFAKDSYLFFLVHALVDVPLVTGAVYITGGSASPFVFLYILLVMVASTLVSRNAGLGVAILSAFMYANLLSLTALGIIQPADEINSHYTHPASLAVQCLGLTFGMLLVALGTSFLRSRLLSSYALVNKSQETLRALSSEQDRLLDDFPGGIITTDLSYAIKNMNQAARLLLQIEGVSSEHLRLDSLLPFSKSNSPSDWLSRESETTQLEIFSGRSGAPTIIEALCKPVRDSIGKITGLAFFLHDVTLLKTAEEKLELQERMARLLADQRPKNPLAAPLGELIGESGIMQKVFDIIQRVSGSEATVLVTGESGTGKELVARAIHYNSPRATQPFVAVNCGAIPENLIESELFGHKRGAFTGAEFDTTGLFRQASGGTLFLDEIGELPLLMQAKILRSLQERTVRPVGATTDIPIDVRIVAATNRNIRKEVENGKFREDLFYRLNVIGIHLPPLRERRNDIPLLMHSMLHRTCKGKPIPVVSPQAAQILMSYNYPGNVRELENILERAVVLGGDVILPEQLPELTSDAHQSDVGSQRPDTLIIEDPNLTFPINLDELLATIERRYIEIALGRTNGAKKKAAGLLGLNFRSFRYRLQKFGMSADSPTQEH
jgi:two-component system response regulator PilR (NtrC family)